MLGAKYVKFTYAHPFTSAFTSEIVPLIGIIAPVGLLTVKSTAGESVSWIFKENVWIAFLLRTTGETFGEVERITGAIFVGQTIAVTVTEPEEYTILSPTKKPQTRSMLVASQSNEVFFVFIGVKT
jgi:hypothetical protein